MNSQLFSFIILLIFVSIRSLSQMPSIEKGLAIVGVNVITMNGYTTLKNQIVVIESGKILKIVPAAALKSIPAHYKRIDGKNLTLLPGLADMHTHLRRANYDSMLTYVALGITTLREMNGRPFILNWRDSIEKELMIGPRLFVASPAIGNFSSPREGFPTPGNQKQVDSLLSAYKSAGYNFIKVHNFIKDTIYDYIAKFCRLHHMKLVGHTPVELTLQQVINAGQISIEHFTGYTDCCMTRESQKMDAKDFRGIFHAVYLNDDSLKKYVDLTVKHKVWNVPTITFFDRILPAPQVAKIFGNDDLRKLGLQTRKKILMALHKKKALIMFGTDSDAGEDLPASVIYEEMDHMKAAGMSNYEILRTATVMPAIFLGEADRRGKILPGMDADILIVEGNPLIDLSDLKKVKYVISRGRIVVAK